MLQAELREDPQHAEKSLPSDDGDAWDGIACWNDPITWLAQVWWAYEDHYERLRPWFCDARGRGGVSADAVLKVAAVRAKYADHLTGRNSYPSVRRIERETGFSERKVQRATKFLRLAGLATEVLRGRLRTLEERLNCHQVGDKRRGWASVYALHPPRNPRVIHKARTCPLAEIGSVTPHLEGSLLRLLSPYMQKLLSRTGKAGSLKRRASRDPQHRKAGMVRRRRAAPDPDGLRLALRWAQTPESPSWLGRHSPATWARVLKAPAAHGWTVGDLQQLLRDHISLGGWLADSPDMPPIVLLAWLLKKHGDLADRPAAYDDLREEAAARRREAIAACNHCGEDGMVNGHQTIDGIVRDVVSRCAHTGTWPTGFVPQ